MTTDTKADQMDQYTSSSGRVWVPLADHERVVRELETHYWEAIDYAQEALAASRAEVEGLKSKAARYDWIRMNAVLDGANGDQLDAEIDAAMENNNV